MLFAWGEEYKINRRSVPIRRIFAWISCTITLNAINQSHSSIRIYFKLTNCWLNNIIALNIIFIVYVGTWLDPFLFFVFFSLATVYRMYVNLCIQWKFLSIEWYIMVYLAFSNDYIVVCRQATLVRVWKSAPSNVTHV